MIAGLVHKEKAEELIANFKSKNPDEIVCVGTHNAPGSLTFSGLESSMAAFKDYLVELGVKVRDVDTNGVGFHSPLLLDVADDLAAHLNKIIPNKRSKPEKWVSTSVPETEWDNEANKEFDGNYHVYNFTHTVLFEDVASKHIPKNAVVVEIGPQPLLISQVIKCVGNDGNLKKNIIAFFAIIGI